MKNRNYEKKTIIIFCIILLFILELIYLLLLFLKKEYNYTTITGIVQKENLLVVIASKEERKYLHNNAYIYLEAKKEPFKIIEDRGIIITKDNKKYYELLIKVQIKKEHKINDTVVLSIKTTKQRLIKIFKTIKEGD